LDNGKEFVGHEAFSQATGVDVYFAHPYHSWERSTNRNTNGLIRRLYPKQSSFADLGLAELKRLETFF
jgi:IS30 family transposase